MMVECPQLWDEGFWGPCSVHPLEKQGLHEVA